MPDFENFDLASFERPPVIETVLSLQFERLLAMRAVHFGLFWERVKTRFPKTEEHPPLAPVVESFPDLVRMPGQIFFESIEPPTLPRVWMINDAGTEVIQVQADRFIKNWRKSADHDVYPHYDPVIKPAFEQDLSTFQQFLSDEKLGALHPTQCEVTYVNHIISGEGWNGFGEADRIFRFWRQISSKIPGVPEDLGFRARFPIEDLARNRVGRLHVDVQPALRATDGQPMYVLSLTARGPYTSAFNFFDIGRTWIVKSFENLTTEQMHKIWGRR